MVRKIKTSSEQQFCGQKRLLNERGQRRRAKADRKVTVTQITIIAVVCRRTSPNTQCVKPRNGYATAAEDLISKKNICLINT